ncbi:AMP-binding protein, partial [Salmonella enterica subsp. enterica serovar Infantis]
AVSSETAEERTFTFTHCHEEVKSVAANQLSLGVQGGERVMEYMPMMAEAKITLRACAGIGAIHSLFFGVFASHRVGARIEYARRAVILSA